MRERHYTETDADRSGKDGTRRRDLKPLARLWGFLRPHGLIMAGATLALTVSAGTVLVMGSGLKQLIDRGFGAGDRAMLDQAVLALFAVVAVMAAASFARFYLVSWLGERVVADLRRAVFDHVLRLSPAFYETSKVGEILAVDHRHDGAAGRRRHLGADRAAQHPDGRGRHRPAGHHLAQAHRDGAAGRALVIAPILLYGRRVRKLSRASQDRIADVGAYVEEQLAAIRTVQAFTHEPIDRRLFGDRVEDAFATALDRVRARSWMTALVILLVFGAIALVMWIGGHDVLAGRISAGELASFVFYAVIVASSVGAISEVMGDLQRAAGAAERLFDLLDTVPAIAAPADPLPLPVPGRGRSASRTSPSAIRRGPEQSALEDFSLAVKPGETLALVGPSGAGKTTVFQLALRFYDPDQGTIRLDGIGLRQADPAAVRARIALVSQEPSIFSADVTENIRYGRPDATDAEVRAAADAAQVTEFADKLPQGFATPLGERGVRLSGGQRQRVAIARAILRDAPLLLLDEATSALDAESEHLVQAALERLMQGRTTIIIAHRLATVLKAERIVVLDEGRIVATGSHGELINAGGLYARLAKLQFDDRRAEAG